MKSIPMLDLIGQARKNAKYYTKTSELNKKWIRFLKNKKLFDEYMVYLGNNNAIGIEPKTYKQISNVCYNLNGQIYHITSKFVLRATIQVDWKQVFEEFCQETIKWYNIKEFVLYLVNNGYK